MARNSLRRWPSRNTKLLQVLIRQIGQDAVVYSVLAERRPRTAQGQGSQPACHVHDTAALAQACP